MSAPEAPGAPARLGILLSGRGSNFLALHGAIERGELPAEIALVVANVSSAPGLARARELGVPTRAIPHREAASREEHERRVLAALGEAGVEWVCLAGYMRLLSPAFVARFPWRIVNVHPSLLPAFPGLDAQGQAFAYGAKISGCTVHLVDEGLDSGPVVSQEAVAIGDAASRDEVAARILAAEHRTYPWALARLLSRPWRIEGRRVIFADLE